MSYVEMLERLGISNKEFNLKKITENLSKGRVEAKVMYNHQSLKEY